MDALRGMKLLHKEGDKNLAISIAVDFDTTKHLNEANIKRRQIIRDRLIMRENEKREEERRRTEEEEKKKEQERFVTHISITNSYCIPFVMDMNLYEIFFFFLFAYFVVAKRGQARPG